MRKILLSLLVLIFISACSSYKPPQKYDFPKSRTYEKSYDEVWTKIVQWFAMKNTPIRNMDKSSGFISTEYGLTVDDYSGFCDCGEPGSLSSITNIFGNFNVMITKQQDNKINVTINSFFKSEISTYNPYVKQYVISTANCNSKGVLEKELFDFIGR